MFIEEAEWIAEAVGHLPLPATVLDVGSSTSEFRERVQPHIQERVFRPLQQRGCEIVHLDAKEGNGVDLTCDLTDPTLAAVAAVGRTFQLVLCCNLLEHVVDRPLVARNITALVADGGFLLVTVPQRYRYHEDPIDTMYRPQPAELAELFSKNGPLVVRTEATVRIDRRQYYRPFPPAPLNLRLADAARWALAPLRWRQSCLVLERLATCPG